MEGPRRRNTGVWKVRRGTKAWDTPRGEPAGSLRDRRAARCGFRPLNLRVSVDTGRIDLSGVPTHEAG